MGYYLAGFDVTGVDNRPQPNYPFTFHQADALTFPLDGFDLVHASWPCEYFAKVTAWRGRHDDHPDLLTPGRKRLESSGLPWVMENVPEAPLRPDYLLCGTQFALNIRRHRAFETSWGGAGTWSRRAGTARVCSRSRTRASGPTRTPWAAPG